MTYQERAVKYITYALKATHGYLQTGNKYSYRGPDLHPKDFPEHGRTIREILASPVEGSVLNVLLNKFYELAFQAGYTAALTDLIKKDDTSAEDTAA